MASITDKFGKASIDSDYAIATTVKTTRSSGATVLEAFDVSKFPDDTPAFFITYKKTTDPVTGIVSVTNLVSWKALVNAGANTLTNLTLAPGYSDSGNAPGDFIELVPTSFWENTLVDGLLVSHDQDGKLKAGAISNSNMLANNTVTTPAITDASVTPAKMLNGLVMQRKGGSPTAWGTGGNNNYDVSALGVKIQVGSATVGNGTAVITFPAAFTNTPIVLTDITSYGASSINKYILSLSASSFTIYVSGLPAAMPLSWIAIGI